MADANAVNEIVSQVATPDNVAMAADIGSNVLAFAGKTLNDMLLLLQQNIWWGIVVLGLMYAGNWALEQTDLPIPGGKVRWVTLFFVVMFFSWLWVGFFSAWVK